LKPKSSQLAILFLVDAQKLLVKEHLPHIVNCLHQLSEEEIWWRPNAASNSAGNLVLHLCGNVRQWIITNLGESPDVRDRDSEFAERGPIPRKVLVAKLKKTMREACDVLRRLPEASLSRKFKIQGLRVTGLEVISHIVEHFAYHTGQIIFITKFKRGKDLRFTNLPPAKIQKKINP
jgi:uncharacterized damage-inducible protein DinB